MQIQENRTTTGAPVDPFIAVRETQLGFALPSTNCDVNLFAEIFNSFAASAPPPSPTNVEPSQSSALTPEPAPETTQDKDNEDLSDDPSDRTGLTPYGLPVASQSILTRKVDAAAKCDLKAKSIDNSDSQSRSASVDPLPGGNAGKEPIATLTEKPTDESTSNAANLVAVPIEQIKKQDVAPENHVSTLKQTKTTSETSDSASSVSQNDQQPTSPVGDASSDQPTQLNNEVATSDATQATSGVSDGSQSSDRGDRRRRSNDGNNRASGVARQEPTREIPKDSSITPVSSANSTPEAPSSAVSNGFGSADSIGNASTSTASQVGPAASYLAAPQAIAIQRDASGSVMRGSVVQGVQSASGATSTRSFTRGSERSAESAGADSTPSSRRTDIADRARLVHRIAKAFQKMGIDSGQVRLKMHPDELGGVQIEMQVTGRSVKAKVIADGEDARQLLRDSMPELRQRLESQGLTVERLDVELRSENERSSLMNQNQQQQNQRSHDEAASRNGVWRRPAEARNTIKVVDTKPEPRLDVRTAKANRSLDLKI